MDEDEALTDLLRAERRQHLIEPATIHGSELSSTRAKQHLMEGFNRRVLMLQRSIEYVYEVAENAAGRPLSTFVISELAIHVNSLWLNLCGALDNLAWALAYEFQMSSTLGEGAKQGRDAVGLTKKEFLTWLERIDPPLRASLRPFEAWLLELRDLRDPAAHRIPLYPIPGLLHGTAAENAKELMAQANEQMRAGELSEGLALINQANDLAEFRPWMALSHDGRIEMRDIHSQMRLDEDRLLVISALILNRLFRDAPKYRPI